jgi:hypothetical protein
MAATPPEALTIAYPFLCSIWEYISAVSDSSSTIKMVFAIGDDMTWQLLTGLHVAITIA